MKLLATVVLCAAVMVGMVSCRRKIQCRLMSSDTTPAPSAQNGMNSSEFEMIMAKLDALDLRILKTEFAVQNTVHGIASDVESLGQMVEKLAWVASQSEQSSSFVEHHVKLLEHNLTTLIKDVRELINNQQKIPTRNYIDNALLKLKLQTKLESDPMNEQKVQKIQALMESLFKKEEEVIFNMAVQTGMMKEPVYEFCDQLDANKSSGVYLIHPDGDFMEPMKVYCNQSYNGGGWTVIQKRFNGTVNFYRDYKDYKRGFGRLEYGEFWAGLERIHRLTYTAPHEMVVVMEDWDGVIKYAAYENFEVSGEHDQYKVNRIDGYSGTAGDSMSYVKNASFSTFDHDFDTSVKQNCAVKYHGAWWYKSCHSSNLNGKYLRGQNSEFGVGMNWDSFRGMKYALQSSMIMIRRRKDMIPEWNLRQALVRGDPKQQQQQPESAFKTVATGNDEGRQAEVISVEKSTESAARGVVPVQELSNEVRELSEQESDAERIIE